MFADASEEALKQAMALLEQANNPYIEQYRDKDLTNYLIQQMAFRLAMGIVGSRPSWKETSNYVCMEHFVLVHGRFYRGVRLPKHYRSGPIKRCYDNSREGMNRYPNLEYVEGYVTSMIPIMHAWNQDANGDVVELTLREAFLPVKDRSYFGVLFDADYAAYTHGSVIDDWEENWPLLHDADLVSRVVIPPAA